MRETKERLRQTSEECAVFVEFGRKIFQLRFTIDCNKTVSFKAAHRIFRIFQHVAQVCPVVTHRRYVSQCVYEHFDVFKADLRLLQEEQLNEIMVKLVFQGFL
jgi:hypothetical protein